MLSRPVRHLNQLRSSGSLHLRSTPFPIEPRPIYVELRFVQPTCPEITTWVGGYLYCRLTLDIRSDSSFQEGLVRLGMIVAPIVRLVEPRLEIFFG
jgi:hypothetical protein